MCEALRKFLADGKISHAAFAQRIGKTQAAVSRYCNGRIPRDKETMQAIERETCGMVTAADFYAASGGGAS